MDERDKDGNLTDYALAMDALHDLGCDCGTDEAGTCLACVCRRALLAERKMRDEAMTERDALQKQKEEVIDRLESARPFAVKSIHWNAGEPMEATCEHWGVKMFAASFAETLGDAPNYLSINVDAPIEKEGKVEYVPLEVTIRRRQGKTPAARAAEFEKARDAALLRARRAEMRYRCAESLLNRHAGGKRVMCMLCGKGYDVDDPAWLEHDLTCPKHPMREVERRFCLAVKSWKAEEELNREIVARLNREKDEARHLLRAFLGSSLAGTYPEHPIVRELRQEVESWEDKR
jgi:hypothetical protein